jgi:hypothetical protein
LKSEPEEVSAMMLIPQYLIIGVMIMVAIFPGILLDLIGAVLNTGTFPSFGLNMADVIGYSTILKQISLYSFLFIVLTGSVFLVRWLVTKKIEEEISSTWGCGYPTPGIRMQYTGKSFSKSFGKLLNFMLIEKKGYEQIGIDETFPAERKYRSFYLDFFESKIINPIMFLVNRFINMFQFIQNGKIQAYVIYGIVFILVIFIGTVLKFWN